MRMDTKLFDDMARLAASAMGTVAGMREEMEAQFRQQVERILSRMDVVSREEHEAARDMAAAAREQQEELAAKVEQLERRVAELEAAQGPKRTRTAAPPAAAKAPQRKPATKRTKAKDKPADGTA